MELCKGRAEGRIPKEMRCYDLLDGLGIEYWRVDHEHADTIEACHEVEKTLGCGICKNLLLTNRQQSQVFLLLMPGDKVFKTKLLSKQIGSARLSFATAEQMEKYLDITPGSVSVLGLMNDRGGDVRLIMDRQLADQEYLGCHPCINTSTLRVKTRNIIDIFLPAVNHSLSYVELKESEEE